MAPLLVFPNNIDSIREIKQHIRKILQFLNIYEWLPDIYVSDFYVLNYWEKLLPSWRDCFQKMTPSHIAQLLTPNSITKNNIILPLSLLAYRSCTQSLSLKRTVTSDKELNSVLEALTSNVHQNISTQLPTMSQVTDDPIVISNIQYSGGQYISLDAQYRKHVKPKKQHEIHQMSKVIGNLCEILKYDKVVDIGAGLGHLSRLLNFKYNLTVTTVEAATGHAAKAHKFDLDLRDIMKKKRKIQDSQQKTEGSIGDNTENNLSHGVNNSSKLVTSQCNIGDNSTTQFTVSDNTTTSQCTIGDITTTQCNISDNTTSQYNIGDNTTTQYNIGDITTTQCNISDNTTSQYNIGDNTTSQYNISDNTTSQYNIGDNTSQYNISDNTSQYNISDNTTTTQYNIDDNTTTQYNIGDITTISQCTNDDITTTQCNIDDITTPPQYNIRDNTTTPQCNIGDNTGKSMTSDINNTSKQMTSLPNHVIYQVVNNISTNDFLHLLQTPTTSYKSDSNEKVDLFDSNFEERYIPKEDNNVSLRNNYDTLGSIKEKNVLPSASQKSSEYEQIHRTCSESNLDQENSPKFCSKLSNSPNFLDEKLMLKESNIDTDQLVLCGLHACGDLTTTIIHMFTKTKDISALAIVGCCYMKLTTSSDSSLPDDANYGYPMSQHLQTLHHHLTYEARELACHFLDSYHKRLLENMPSLRRHWYRAALQCVVKAIEPNFQHGCIKISIKNVEKLSFEAYLEKALKSLGFNISQVPSNVIDQCKTTEDQWKDVVCLYTVRLCIAPVIETLLLLDRMLYILELGIPCALVPIFEPLLSPRNFILLAAKVPH